MILTDTHTHLYLEQFDEDRDLMMQRALDLGVERIFLPNIDSTTTEGMMNLCTAYPHNCFPMIGLHPCSVKPESYDSELKHVTEMLAREKFIAIGEIGIDLYWDKTTLEIQQEAFDKQINIAIESDLPIAIHCRDSFDEVYNCLVPYKGKVNGVFHCFTGSDKDAEKVNELDFYFGLGGVLTFKNSGLDEVAIKLPKEKIILETDSPYLTPVPFRGKRNESSYVYHVAERLATIWDMSVNEVADLTTKNSQDLFKV